MPYLPDSNITKPNESAAKRPLTVDDLPEITPEMVAFYIQRGKTMRSQYILAALRGLFKRSETTSDVPVTSQPASASQTLLNALAAMRSSMEVLRDTPDISEQDRVRFARNALSEEARAERILKDMIGGSAKLA